MPMFGIKIHGEKPCMGGEMSVGTSGELIVILGFSPGGLLSHK